MAFAIGALLLVPTAGAAAAERRPNLLVIVTDDQRADTLSAMRRTRAAFAQRSTRYPNAHVSTPLCCPSRATIFSGLYAHNHRVWTNDAGEELDQGRTAQHWLQQSGYRTGLVGKFLNGWPTATDPPHWNRFWVNGGAHQGANWNVNGQVQTVEGFSTTFATAAAREFIGAGERRDRKPWFLYLASSEPHAPLTPQPRHQSLQFPPMSPTPAMTETDLADKPAYLRDQAEEFDQSSPPPEEVRLAQLRLLQAVDEMVGSVFRRLRETDELRDTLVVFVSDNGLLWGEHGGAVIKDLPYDASTHVPLLIRWPAALGKRPKVDRRLVSTVDLAPTLLDVGDVGKAHKVDGRSLRFRGWQRDHLLLEYGGFRGNGFVIPPWSALRSETQLFASYASADPYPAETEYYDLADDPWERESNPAAAPPALSAELAQASRCRGAKNCP